MQPSPEALAQADHYAVGDKVYLTTSGDWTVMARYWSRRLQGIVYDLVYDKRGGGAARGGAPVNAHAQGGEHGAVEVGRIR